MARVLVTEDYLEDIGDAIRSKLEVETTYKPSEMATAIESIEGYPEPTGTKSITANGTGIDVKDYAEADVNVPNSYSQSDEGKVVDNGALVAQTSQNITDNGTYDTTLKSEVVVNVSGGGGGGSGAMVEPDFQGLSYAYISTAMGFHGSPTQNNSLNIFPVVANHEYEIFLGSTTDNRYRVHFYGGKTIADFQPYLLTASASTDKIYDYTTNISGTTDKTNYSERYLFTPNSNGVIIVGTSNQSVVVPAYCVDMDAS